MHDFAMNLPSKSLIFPLKCPCRLQGIPSDVWHPGQAMAVLEAKVPSARPSFPSSLRSYQGSPSQVGKYVDHIDILTWHETTIPDLSRIYLNTRSSMIPMEIHGFTCFVVLRGSYSWGQLPPGGIEPGSWQLFRSPTPALRKPATYRSMFFFKEIKLYYHYKYIYIRIYIYIYVCVSW